MKNVMPHLQGNLKIITNDDLARVLMLNKFAVKKDGTINDPNLLADLCYVYLTFFSADR